MFVSCFQPIVNWTKCMLHSKDRISQIRFVGHITPIWFLINNSNRNSSYQTRSMTLKWISSIYLLVSNSRSNNYVRSTITDFVEISFLKYYGPCLIQWSIKTQIWCLVLYFLSDDWFKIKDFGNCSLMQVSGQKNYKMIYFRAIFLS